MFGATGAFCLVSKHCHHPKRRPRARWRSLPTAPSSCGWRRQPQSLSVSMGLPVLGGSVSGVLGTWPFLLSIVFGVHRIVVCQRSVPLDVQIALRCPGGPALLADSRVCTHGVTLHLQTGGAGAGGRSPPARAFCPIRRLPARPEPRVPPAHRGARVPSRACVSPRGRAVRGARRHVVCGPARGFPLEG